MRIVPASQLFVLCLLSSAPAWAAPISPPIAPSPPPVPTEPPDAEPLSTEGRPNIVLDYLELPAGVPSVYRKQLKTILYRETRRVRWGAGTGSTITYRYYVTRLEFQVNGDVLKVTCHAVGKLPKGKTAMSTLSFSGPLSDRGAVVKRVLEIVARGVVTRLAEMERIRRGDL